MNLWSYGPDDLIDPRELRLRLPDPHRPNHAARLDHEHCRPRDVPRVVVDALPDAVLLCHRTVFVDQHEEGQPALFDVATHRRRLLGEDGDDRRAARRDLVCTIGQFTEPALAVW